MHRNNAFELFTDKSAALISLGFMHDHGECVHKFLVQHDVEFHKL